MAFGASKLDEEHHEEPQQEVDNQGEEARVFDPRSTQYQFSPNPTARSNRLPSQQPVGLILDDASDMMDVVLDDMDASEHNKHSVVRRVHPETDLTDSEVCHDDVRWTRSDACAPTSNLGHFSTPRSSKKNKFSISIADAGEEDTFDALFPEESEVCVAQEEEEEDPHGMTGQPSQPLVSNAVANGKKRGHTDYSLIVEDSQGETEEEAEVLQLSSDDEAEKDDAVPQVASILPAPVRAPYAIQFIPKKRRFSGKFGCSPPPKPIIVPERIPAPAPAPQPAVRSAASTAPKARSRPIRPFSFRPSKPCAPSASTNPRPRMGRPPKKRRLPASFQQQQQQGTSSSGNARPKSRPFVIVEGVKAFL